jgi:hypothetical protein
MPSVSPDPRATEAHVDVSTLSAYYDGALDRAARQDVDTHVAVCPICRGRLDSYIALGDAIQAITDGPLPASLDARLTGLLRRTGTASNPDEAAVPAGEPVPNSSSGAGRLRRFFAPVALLVLIVAAFLAGRLVAGESSSPLATAIPAVSTAAPTLPVPTPSLVPTSAPTAIPTRPILALAPVVTPTIVPTLSAPSPTPAAACTTTPVRGFGLLYQNQPALATKLGCPVAAESAVDLGSQTFQNGRLIWRSDTNQTVALFNGDHSSLIVPSLIGTTPSLSAASVGAGVAVMTPTTAAPAGSIGVAPGTPTPATPGGSGSVAPLTPTPATASAQSGKFAAVLAGGSSDLAQRLGAATSPELQLTGAAENFQHGTLVWTPDYTIFAIYSSNSWEQYADQFRDATPTPGPANATPAAAPSPRPPTPSPIGGCVNPPVRGFGLIYQQNASVATRLGCPLGSEAGTQITQQPFDGGQMLWPGNVGDILVLKRDGTWTGYPNTWQAGQPLTDPGAPPAGHLAPVGSFGKIWGEQAGVRSALGWATAAAQPVQAAEQTFAQGRMLWTADHSIYVLYPDDTWQSFADTFTG